MKKQGKSCIGNSKVKNLINVLASIGALIDDEDLVTMTLNGFGKDYS